MEHMEFLVKTCNDSVISHWAHGNTFVNASPWLVYISVTNICNNRNDRRELKERGIAFVRLAYKIPPASKLRIRSDVPELSAYYQGGFQSTGCKQAADKRSCRRFTMGAANGNPALQPHKLGKHLRPRDHRDTTLFCLLDLNVPAVDSG